MMENVPSPSNGQEESMQNQGTDEKSKRHPRWTVEETLTLIQAKDITEGCTNRGRKITSLLASDYIEPKWVSISSYCKQHGVNRKPAQCRKRWSNLIADFKKIKTWESKLTDRVESYWVMRNDLRKDRKLPVSFDRRVFDVLTGREVGLGSGFVMAPLPLQAVACTEGWVCDDGVMSECGGDGDECGEQQVEVDEEMVVFDVKCGSEEQKRGTNNVDDVFVNAVPVLEQQEQGFHDHNGCSNQEEQKQGLQNQTQRSNQDTTPVTSAYKETRPSFSDCESMERGKRQRTSRDGDEKNDMEAHIIRVLETNNKMLNAQLDILKENRELEKEQKKENNDALVAALDKLTNVLVKIAEKL